MRVTVCRWVGVALLLVAAANMPARGQQKQGNAKPPREAELILKLTNAERARAGLPALRLSPALTRAAQGHSDDMARRQQMSHTLNDRGPADRAHSSDAGAPS